MTRRNKSAAGLVAFLLSGMAPAQAPPGWTVSLTPTLSPLPVGMCGAVHLRIFDAATRDVPRNAQGTRITMADFDLSVDGASVAGNQIDAYHFDVCGCPGGAPGGAARVRATYPAQSLAANARVRGVQFAVEAPVFLAEPKGSSIPRACAAIAAASTPDVAPQPAGNFSALPQTAITSRGPADPFAPAPSPSGIRASNDANSRTSGGVSGPGTGTGSAGAGTGSSAQPSVMSNPAGFTSIQTAPNTVLLHWQPVAGVSYYALFGPGLPSGGVKVSNATAYTATQVPAGSNEWAVGSYYEPGPTSTAAASFPRVALNVSGPITPAAPAASASTSTGPASTNETMLAVCKAQAAQQASSSQLGAAVAGGGQLSQAQCTLSANQPDNTPQQPPAPGTFGRYLVTVLGFRAYAVSKDDPLSRDGYGDEAYAAAYIRRYDRRTDTLVSTATCRTRTYGDIAVPNSATLSNSCTSSPAPSQQSEVVSGSLALGSKVALGMPRIQAGTWMPTGGIKDLDMVPAGPAIAVRNQTPKENAFPWRLWEGTLIDGVDALVISPTLWEQDGAVVTTGLIGGIDQALQQLTQVFYNQWRQQQQALDSSIFGNTLVQGQITGKRFGMIADGAQSNTAPDSGLINHIGMAAFGLPLGSLLTSSSDRPIGLVSSGFDQTALPNRLVVLTREIIEAALAGPALGVIPSMVPNVPGVGAPLRGIIMVPFYDGRMPLGSQGIAFLERPAQYQMFIQVERLP